MSAYVDLLVLKKVCKHPVQLSREGKDPSLKEVVSPPLYKLAWIITHFTDTSGLMVPGSRWEVTDEGRKFFFDSLFGNGPKRLGLESARPIVPVDYDILTGKLSAHFPQKYRDAHYLVERSVMFVSIHDMAEKRKDTPLTGLSTEDFFDVLDDIPANSTFWEEKTTPMTAFIRALDSAEYLIIPLIGIGIEYDDHFPPYSITRDY